METKTKGQVAAEISEVVIKFKREHVGKGPKEVKSYIIDDMVVIRLKGVLTTYEQQLTDAPESIELIKRCRVCCLKNAQSILRDLLHNLLDVDITSFYVDVNPKIGEIFVVLSLSENVEAKFTEKRRLLKTC